LAKFSDTYLFYRYLFVTVHISSGSHAPRGNLVFAKAALIQGYRVQRSTFPRRSVGTRSGGEWTVTFVLFITLLL